MFFKKKSYHCFPVLLMSVSFLSYSYTQDIPINIKGNFVTGTIPCNAFQAGNGINMSFDYGMINLTKIGDKQIQESPVSILCQSEAIASIVFNSPAVNGGKYYQTTSSDYGVQITLDGEEIIPGKTINNIKLISGANVKDVQVNLVKITSGAQSKGEHSFNINGSMKIDYP